MAPRRSTVKDDPGDLRRYLEEVRAVPLLTAADEDELSTALTFDTADTADVFGILYTGVFAAERGRWGDHRAALTRLRSILGP